MATTSLTTSRLELQASLKLSYIFGQNRQKIKVKKYQTLWLCLLSGFWAEKENDINKRT